MNNSSHTALNKQKRNFLFIACLVIVLILGMGHYVFNNSRAPHYDFFEPQLDLPVDEFKSKEVWMDRLESQVNFLSQKQDYYEKTLLECKERDLANEKEKAELKKRLAQLKQEMEISAEQLTQLQVLQNKVSELESLHTSPEISQNFSIRQETLNASPLSYADNPFKSVSASSEKGHEAMEETVFLKPPLCAYSMPQDKKELISVDKRTPANVTVRAILLSSVDAVCRLDAQSDPVPVKLRLLDDGYLPNGVKVKLKGSLIGASAYGDISNERVYMRLENLTKVNVKGEAIESEVTGYISGEDGRFGMRGIVVDRSTKILKNAVGSGILSGLGQTLQAACTKPSKESFNTYSISSDLAQNSANGASDAFSLLASYYIRRAEQVQPVLQVNAGRVVDITFTQGFSLGDIHTKERLKTIRERSRQKS